jgi:glycosyltransferase involved in cell wall biosynthesis
MNNILCSISTRGRHNTTLPLAILSVINQTLKPDALVIFDDNDTPVDIRNIQHYAYLLHMLDAKGIRWSVVFGERKGQHFNHQKANTMGYKWVWRLDDDTVAEPDALEKLFSVVDATVGVGAVGGSILTPPNHLTSINATGKIENIDNEPNIQWGPITETKEVDHLHCSFLYRAGVVDYNLTLSRVAHREETLFTYNLKKAGYRVLVTPCVTWHLRNSQGGIRDGQAELYQRDEQIFQLRDKTVVVLDCGMGDHIVFKHVLPDIENPLVFSCYPDIVPGRSIAEAMNLLGDIGSYNIYGKMDQWNWKGSLEDAFRKMYVRKK